MVLSWLLYIDSLIRLLRLWLFKIPAAGNCKDGSVNDVGDNGNLWGSALNTENVNNAWYFNFNSNEAGVNNNNRYFGQSVRGVVGQHFCQLFFLIMTVGQDLQFFI